MDSGVAALMGSAIGSLAGVTTAVLNDYLRQRPINRLRNIRKQTLYKLLEHHKFRTLETLSDSIGADDDTTKTLLLEIKARKSRTAGSDRWGLIANNPWPDEGTSE